MAQEHTEANRKYFDELSATYDSKPWQKRMQAQIADELLARLGDIPVQWVTDQSVEQKKVRLLDYACGTGLVSKVLAPSISEAIGIDIAASMVDKYNDMVFSHPYLRDKAHAIVGDLFTTSASQPALNAPSLHNFDIAAVGLGFHHFDDPVLATKRLAERLKSGGVLLIIDFSDQNFGVKKDGAFPKHAAHTVKTHGFSESGMGQIFTQAGLVEAEYKLMQGLVRMGDEDPVTRQVFLGWALKP